MAFNETLQEFKLSKYYDNYQCDEFYVDEYSPFVVGMAFICRLVLGEYNAVLFTTRSKYVVPIESTLLPWLKKLYRFKSFMIWNDVPSETNHDFKFCSNLMAVMDINCFGDIIDYPHIISTRSGYIGKRVFRAHPYPEYVVFPHDQLNNERPYDVAFIGLVGVRRPDRKKYLDAIQRLDIKAFIHTHHGHASSVMSYSDYLNIYSSSKIVLSFSYHGGYQCYQRKGRVIEGMLRGSLVLSQSEDVIKSEFVNGQEYVSFTDSEDLIEKIMYYLDHDNERMAIARSAYDKVIKDYSSINCWKAYLDELFDDKNECGVV